MFNFTAIFISVMVVFTACIICKTITDIYEIKKFSEYNECKKEEEVNEQ